MGDFTDNHQPQYCPNYNQQYDMYGNSWAYLPPHAMVANQYVPDMGGNQSSAPTVQNLHSNQPAMLSNAHGPMLPSSQPQYLSNPGMVQGPYHQGPIMMPTLVGYQPRPAGYYYNTQSPQMPGQYMNYDAAAYGPSNYPNEDFNGAGVRAFQQDYTGEVYPTLPMMQAQYMQYDMNHSQENMQNIPQQSQLLCPSNEQQQQQPSSGSSYSNGQGQNNKYLYDDTFPPEFVPRFKYTLPPQDSYQCKPSVQPDSPTLQIQTMPNETDLLPAGLLSPSLDSRSKSTISDLDEFSETEKDQSGEILVLATPPSGLPIDKADKPPSPLPGYKIFEPQIKYKMFGPKDVHSDEASGITEDTKDATLDPNASHKHKQNKTVQKQDSPEVSRSQNRPPSLMQISVESPLGPKNLSVKQVPSKTLPGTTETQNNGAKSKIPSKKITREVSHDATKNGSASTEFQKQVDRYVKA